MLGWMPKMFAKRNLMISQFMSYEDYINHGLEHDLANLQKRSFEENLIPDTCSEFTFNGYCHVCRRYVDFMVDFAYACKRDGVLMPNWRERLVCPKCRLNNRMRATINIFEQEFKPTRKSSIYITEQTTALYKWFKKAFSNVCGSEYLGESVGFGSYNDKGIKNEDLTRLSFEDDKFDFILSFDVFEHIPNYKKAFMECCRCLKPGGTLYFTVPFDATAERNIVRACLSSTGEVIHLLPPEYHGNPVSSEGCLCFYNFGWEVLDELNEIGFKESKALFYWSQDLGYLGGDQLLLAAKKFPQQ